MESLTAWEPKKHTDITISSSPIYKTRIYRGLAAKKTPILTILVNVDLLIF